GIPGELLIGGAGGVWGYFKRPHPSTEKIIPNPFAKSDGAQDLRFYKNCDLARYFSDGKNEVLWPRDHQVKLRGYRIELGEIEAAIRQRAEIKDCVVIVREDVPGDKRLVSYVVLQSGAQLQPTELRKHLNSKLPDYMVPSNFVAIERLPLTP